MVVTVLERLDELGEAGAGSALLEHVATGVAWDEAIAAIARAGTETRERLPTILVKRFDHEQLTWLAGRYDGSGHWDDGLPWERWSVAFPQIRAAVAANEAPEPRVERRPPSTDRPLADLLNYHWGVTLPADLIQRLTKELQAGEREALIKGCNLTGSRCLMPFVFLGSINDPTHIETALSILESDEVGVRRVAANRYIRALGPEHTLELARERMTAGDRFRIAEMIFALHAELQDLGIVRSRLTEAWELRELYSLVDMLEALQLHPEQGPFDELPAIFEEIEYSYGRAVTAETMAASDPMFGERFARECLWDSEPRIQELGAEFVVTSDDQAEERRQYIVEYEGRLPS